MTNLVDANGNPILIPHDLATLDRHGQDLVDWLLRAHNPDGTLKQTIPTEAPPAQIRLLHRQASNYSDTMPGPSAIDTTAQQGQKYRYIAMQGFNSDEVATLKASGGTGVAICVYKECTFNDNTNPGSTNMGYAPLQPHAISYQEPGYNETWYCHQLGQTHDAAHRQTFSSGRYALVNIGLPALQVRAAQNIIQEIQNLGFDGVFLDNCLWQMTFTSYPDEYPSQVTYQAAMESYLAYVTAQVRNAGHKVYGNIGSGGGTSFKDRRKFWCQNYFQGGGAMEEGWIRADTAHTGARGSIENFWIPNFIQILQDSEIVGCQFLAEIPADDYSSGAQAVEDIRYGIGLVLIASKCDGSTTVDVGGTANPGDGSHYYKQANVPEFADMVRLGTPLSSYVSQAGGCYLRTFANGIAVLNPHNTTKSASLPLGTWAGWGVASAAGTLSLAATTAKVLFSTSSSPFISKASENTYGANATPSSQTLFGVPNNSVVVVQICFASASQTVNSVIDDKGNVYSRIGTVVTGASSRLDTFMASNVTGGDLLITTTLSASRDHAINFSAWKFLADAETFETSVQQPNAASTTASAPTYTPAAQPILLIASCASDFGAGPVSGQASNPTGGFTAMNYVNSGSATPSIFLATAFKYIETGGVGVAQNVAWTLANSVTSETRVIGIKNA